MTPEDSLGLTDLVRAMFHAMNADALPRLVARAKERATMLGEAQAVVCIDVDDPAWTKLVDRLMPGHDWDAYRGRGEKPVTRGVVPTAMIEEFVAAAYPAAEAFSKTKVNVCIFAAGGIAVTHEV